MTTFPAARRVRLPRHVLPDGSEDPGITLAVHELGDGPAVVLCHGFPELAFSWRHQLPALAAAGFRAIAPDQRGYGGSDRPEPIRAYDMHHLTGDLAALLDALEVERAVFVGHDWGGFVAWAMPVLHPERSAGVVGVNTPYLARAPVPPTTLFRMLLGAPDGSQDEKMYILWFQQPGVAEAVLDRDVHRVFDVLMRRALPPEMLAARAAAAGTLDMNPFRRLAEIEIVGEPLLSPDEMDVFVRTFERTGFGGGVHWYRNFDRNWQIAPAVGTTKIGVPALMVTAQWDPVLRPELAAGMPAFVPDLETVMIERCGHWTQQEEPDALNRILVDWLVRRFRPGAA